MLFRSLTRRRLTEGSEVTANSMKPLAAAAKLAASRSESKDAGEAVAVDEAPEA